MRACVYFLFGMHEAKWRFTSLPDLGNIVRAATVLAVSLLALDYVLVSPLLYGSYFFGKITILLYWFLQIAFLVGTRIAYRHFRYVRTRHHAREGKPFRPWCSGARPMPRCCCARSRAAPRARCARSASCRRRSRIAASRSAAFRWSAASTISS